MRKVLGLVGATLLFAGPALAADLGVRAPAVPLAPVLGWTGFYIGGNVGVGRGDQAVNFSGDPRLIGPLIATGVIPSSLAGKPSGRIGGVQAGYNWQMGSFVLGVEADIQAANIASGGDLTSRVGATTWTTTADSSTFWAPCEDGWVLPLPPRCWFMGPAALRMEERNYLPW